jgi:hypothetical protein
MTRTYCSRTLVRKEAIRQRNERISFMLSPLFICIYLTQLCIRAFSYMYLSFFLCCFLSLPPPLFYFPPFTAFSLLLSRVCLSLPLLLLFLFLFIFCSFYFFHLLFFVLYLLLYSFCLTFVNDVTLIPNLQ